MARKQGTINLVFFKAYCWLWYNGSKIAIPHKLTNVSFICWSVLQLKLEGDIPVFIGIRDDKISPLLELWKIKQENFPLMNTVHRYFTHS